MDKNKQIKSLIQRAVILVSFAQRKTPEIERYDKIERKLKKMKILNKLKQKNCGGVVAINPERVDSKIRK